MDGEEETVVEVKAVIVAEVVVTAMRCHRRKARKRSRSLKLKFQRKRTGLLLAECVTPRKPRND